MNPTLPGSPNPKGSFTLGKPAARRMKRAIRRVERQLVRPADQRAPRVPALPWLSMQPATLLTTIAGGSFTSPAPTGTCQIWRDSDNALSFWSADTGVCSNYNGNLYPAGSQVTVYWRKGIWWIAYLSGNIATNIYWTRSPTGGIAAAGGSWLGGSYTGAGSTGSPGLTAASFIADIFRGNDAGLTSPIQTGATVWWRFKDVDPGSRLIPCLPNSDGTYDALGDSCTAV